MSPRRWLIALSGLALAAIATAVPADEVREFDLEAPERIAEGAAIYNIYCTNCHGPNAKGDGPISKLLKVRPTNLTRLSRRGDFPTARIYEVIDGRGDVRGHGYEEMPIWGIAFQNPGQDTNQEGEVRARIESLVSYLASIRK